MTVQSNHQNGTRAGECGDTALGLKDIIDEEKRVIGYKGQPVGLSLSGGGIRSASFSIGALQALHKKRCIGNGAPVRLLEKIHYLSSVSGGGYAALAYSWLKVQKREECGRCPGTETDDGHYFPFAHTCHDKKKCKNNEQCDCDDNAGNAFNLEECQKILDFFRHHGRYLTPSGALNILAGVGALLRGAIVTATFYFMCLVVVSMLLWGASQLWQGVHNDLNAMAKSVDASENWSKRALAATYSLLEVADPMAVWVQDLFIAEDSDKETPKSESACAALLGNECSKTPKVSFNMKVFAFGVHFAVLAGFLYLLMLPIHLMRAAFARTQAMADDSVEDRKYDLELRTTKIQGRTLWGILIGLTIALIPVMQFALNQFYYTLLLVGPAAAFARFRVIGGKLPLLHNNLPFLKKFSEAGGSSTVAGAAIFLLGLLALAMNTGEILVEKTVVWWFSPLIPILLLGFVSINHSSIGRYYRDRLMETFLAPLSTIRAGRWQQNKAADTFELEKLASKNANDQSLNMTVMRPYNLVNAHVVLAGARKARYKSRLGDSFLLSPLYVGSEATGYKKTNRYIGKKNTGQGLTLATAMAISGAAANPNTGVGGIGATTNRLVSALMTFFGIRIGYWAPHPCPKNGRAQGTSGWPANMLHPGIKSFLSFGQNRQSSFVELSDGGHFENLGLYELLKRRCNLIIALDAGADEKFEFSDLATAVGRARADGIANIRFDVHEDYDLSPMFPGSYKGSAKAFGEQYKIAERGFAIGRIDYCFNEADGEAEKHKGEKCSSGLLIYLKTTLPAKLSADIYGYKAKNLQFPDQPTSDQFFDERQFEAYRELGYQIASAAMEDPSVKKELIEALKMDTK